MKIKLFFPAFLFSILFVFGISTKVNAQCSAAFTWTATGGTVQLTNTSSAFFTPISSWTFGDSSSYVGYGNTTHTYSLPGTYWVCLTINDTLSSCTSSYCDSVTVLIGCNNLTASATSTDASSQFACDGSATGTATGGTPPYAYQWSNSAVTATINNLCVGNYQFMVTDANGCISNVSTMVNCPFVCNDSFSYYSNGNTAYFTNLSNDTMSSQFNWDFGDFTYSSLTNPSYHTYASAGTYNVLLTMYSSFFGCNDSMYLPVTVGGPVSCGAGFSMLQDSFNLLQWYIYPSVSGQAPFTYLWDFGDSTTSTLAFPNHNYAFAGQHTVCLTITDANLCSSTFCDSTSVQRMNSSAGMQYLTVINVAAGIQEQPAFSASIFPNPVSDLMTISFNKNISGILRLTDIAGKIIFEKAIVSQQKQIDVSMLPQGIYNLSLTSDAINWNEKVVIIH